MRHSTQQLAAEILKLPRRNRVRTVAVPIQRERALSDDLEMRIIVKHYASTLPVVLSHRISDYGGIDQT
ncbi:hypothetical protein WAI453_012255 [Rhynchosporium graminicola]